MARKTEKERYITVKVPKQPVVRVRWVDDRKLIIDFRGIRSKSVIAEKGDPRGNKGAFTSPEKLQRLCDDYFASCNGPIFDKFGNLVKNKDGELVIVQNRPYTVAGLALHLGITTSNLLNYCNGLFDELGLAIDDDRQLSRILQQAKQKIASYAEQRLYDRDGFNGAKLVLDRAFGYLSAKEVAEVLEKRITAKIKEEEWNLKKKLLEEGSEDDGSITINVVRASKKED